MPTLNKPSYRCTPTQRFMAKVKELDNGCWEWMGCRDGMPRKPTDDPRGLYGRFSIDGYHMTGAHRAGYILFVGEIKDGLFVCHKCDNPICVNPKHMFLGTNQENTDDMIRKGRAPHQKPGWVSPRTGTGKYIRINGISGEWKKCVVCKTETLQRIAAVKSGKAPVCSFSCKSIYTSGKLTKKIERICGLCGTKFLRIESQLKEVNYCSRSCNGIVAANKRWHRSLN